MIPTCFEIYYNPIYQYLKKVYLLASENHFLTSGISIVFTAISEGVMRLLNVNYFGISNVLLAIVISTILIDAWFGIRKSLRQSKEALMFSKEWPEGSPERKKFLRVYQVKKFNPTKLQYTFFKSFTLLGYLFFVKNLLNIEEDGTFQTFLEFGLEILVKAPVALFWYMDFKSIGNNMGYLLGKRPPIFPIVERIFEPKINRIFQKEKESNNDI